MILRRRTGGSEFLHFSFLSSLTYLLTFISSFSARAVAQQVSTVNQSLPSRIDLTISDLIVKKFDDIIGLEYLCGMHLNDSKTPLGSKKDRHENVGM